MSVQGGAGAISLLQAMSGEAGAIKSAGLSGPERGPPP